MKDNYMPETLESLEKHFLEVCEIPEYYYVCKCGASDYEDCPSEDTECIDCPYKTLKPVETKISAEDWIELIATCGNKKMLRFPYKNTLEMKKHVLEIMINDYKSNPIMGFVKKFFPTKR